MNVACTQCSAKYAVTDDKVKGRKVRIKCKRCGSPIIVDGTQLGGSVPPAATAAVASKDSPRPRQKTMMGGLQASPELVSAALAAKTGSAKAPPAPAAVPSFKPVSVPVGRAPGRAPALAGLKPAQATNSTFWSVAISDTDVREMPSEEVIAAFASGLIDQYTYIWRDTMTEWLVPFEVPEIASLLKARGFTEQSVDTPTSHLPEDSAGQRPKDNDQEWRELLAKSREEAPPTSAKFDDVTVVMSQEQIEAAHDSLSSLQIQRGEFQSLEVTPTDHNMSWPPEPVEEDEEPEISARPLPVAAQEEEAAEAAPRRADEDRVAAAPRAEKEDDSVEPAFEQIQSEPPADSGLTGARHESSVLFSLRALVQTEEWHERVSEDSLVEGAGGAVPSLDLGQNAVESALVQAVSQPPSIAPIDATTLAAASPEGSGRGKLWLAVGGLLVLGGAAAAYFIFGRALPEPSSISTENISGDPASSAAPATVAPPPEPEPAKPTPPPTPPVEAAASGSAPSAAVPQATAPVAEATPSNVVAKPQPAPPPPRSVPQAEAPAPVEEPAPPPEPPPAGPFNTEAAKATLAAAAANASINCKAPDGTKGSGKVTVIFAPSGRATQAQVSGDFAGTPTGGCIARVFKDTNVPPFSGANVSVSKSVTIR